MLAFLYWFIYRRADPQIGVNDLMFSQGQSIAAITEALSPIAPQNDGKDEPTQVNPSQLTQNSDSFVVHDSSDARAKCIEKVPSDKVGAANAAIPGKVAEQFAESGHFEANLTNASSEDLDQEILFSLSAESQFSVWELTGDEMRSYSTVTGSHPNVGDTSRAPSNPTNITNSGALPEEEEFSYPSAQSPFSVRESAADNGGDVSEAHDRILEREREISSVVGTSSWTVGGLNEAFSEAKGAMASLYEDMVGAYDVVADLVPQVVVVAMDVAEDVIKQTSTGAPQAAKAAMDAGSKISKEGASMVQNLGSREEVDAGVHHARMSGAGERPMATVQPRRKPRPKPRRQSQAPGATASLKVDDPLAAVGEPSEVPGHQTLGATVSLQVDPPLGPTTPLVLAAPAPDDNAAKLVAKVFRASACKQYPACQHLDGLCCPNEHGLELECCSYHAWN